MNPVDLMMRILDSQPAPHCELETGGIRPMEHWQTHCVNCGVYMEAPHIRTDCPPQRYEPHPHENTN